MLSVLEKTLKAIQMVYDSTSEKFFSAPSPKTKFFERLFCRLISNKQ